MAGIQADLNEIAQASHGEATNNGVDIYGHESVNRPTASLISAASSALNGQSVSSIASNRPSPGKVVAANSSVGSNPGGAVSHRATVKLEARKAESDIGSRKAYNRDRAQAKARGVNLASYSTRMAAMETNRSSGQKPS